ncbi:MAG: acyl-CoA dehydrogenase family protein [Acidimicrobiales bacterium]
MDFEFTDEQLSLRDNARAVLASSCPPSVVRAVHDGEPASGELWSTLVGLGWPSVGIAAEQGGLGLGFIEVGIVVEELGRVTAPTPFLATVTQLAPLLREAGATARLAQVADGSRTGTVAFAEDGRWQLDAVATTARSTGSGWILDGVKTHVLDGAGADDLAVIARRPDTSGSEGIGAFLVPRDAVATAPMTVIDPSLPLARVNLAGVEVGGDGVLLDPGDPAAPRAIERALEEATTALALSTTATCRAIFDATLQYAKDREQFGRPIGSFQALKHRLADMYLAVERASALAYYAALTIAEDDERRTVAVSMAKAASGDCQRLVVGDGLQLHGGIGFTWEHDLHLLLKRAKTGDLLFGTAATHRANLARLLGLAA